MFRHRLKKTSKLHVIGLYEGNPPVAGQFPSQSASNVEKVCIWWSHHVLAYFVCCSMLSCSRFCQFAVKTWTSQQHLYKSISESWYAEPISFCYMNWNDPAVTSSTRVLIHNGLIPWLEEEIWMLKWCCYRTGDGGYCCLKRFFISSFNLNITVEFILKMISKQQGTLGQDESQTLCLSGCLISVKNGCCRVIFWQNKIVKNVSCNAVMWVGMVLWTVSW